MAEEEKKVIVQPHPADTNGDGKVDKVEHEMYLEFKRKELEDADAMRDAQRTMAWYSLYGMLLYPVCVVLANLIGLEQAAKILGDMAGYISSLLQVSLQLSLVLKRSLIKVKNNGKRLRIKTIQRTNVA